MSYDAGAVVGRIMLNTRSWDMGHGKVVADLQSMGRVATVWGGLATAAIVKLTKEYGKFEQEMRRATSVIDITEETLASMSKTAEDAAIKWNMAATDTAKAYLFMGRAGLTATEQMQAFPHMILASKAMMEDLEETTEGIINTMNAFGYEFSKTGEVVNIVTEAVNKSTQNLGEMLIALSYSSKPAQSMNNTLSELSAMLAMVANEGIRGSKAGTALRFALTALASPMSDTRRMIRDLGLQVYDVNGKTVPLVNVIGQLQTKLAGATEETRNLVLETLFGRRAMPAMIALYQQSASSIRAFARELEGAGEAAEDVAKRQMKSFLDQVGRMWQALVSLTRHIGQSLAPTFLQWANILEVKFGIWRDWVDSNQEAVKHVMELVTKIGLLSTAFGVAMMVLPSFVNAFKSLYNIIAGIIGLLASPKSLIFNPVVILAGLYVLHTAWVENFKGMRDSVTKIFDDILDNWKYFLDEMNTIATPIINSIVNKFSTFINFIANAFKANWKLFTEGTDEDRLKGFKEFWKTATENPTINENWIQDFVGPQIKRVVGWAKTELAPATNELLKLTLARFKKDMGNVADWFSNVVDDTFDRTIGTLFHMPERRFGYALDFKPTSNMPNMSDPSVWGLGMGENKIKFENPLVTDWKNSTKQILDSMKTLQTGIDSILQSIVDDWANSFEYLMSKGASLSKFFDSLFNDILNSFRRFVAEVTANTLFQAIFMGDKSALINTKGGRVLTWFNIRKDLIGGDKPLVDPYGDLGNFSTPGPTSYPGYSGMSPKIAFVMNNNTGVPVEAVQDGPARFNGEEFVVNVVMKKLGSSSNFRRSFQPEY